MKKFFIVGLAVFLGVVSVHLIANRTHPSVSTNNHIAWWENDSEAYRTTYQEDFDSKGIEPELDSLQCPIPMEDRVRNYTGIQCVFSSIEMLGRWAEEPKLTDPPITSRSNCKSYSGPSDAARKLRALGVKFEQTYQDRKAGIDMIKKAMEEGRGCLFDVPGHAMVLVHYSEEEDRVCWVNNSDRTLKVQEMTVSRFKQRWGSWVLIIYADEDVIPTKLGRGLWGIPIIDWMFPNREYPRDYVPIPRRRAA